MIATKALSRLATVLTAVSLVIIQSIGSLAFAVGAASFSLTSSSNSVAKDQQIVINIDENSGTQAVNALEIGATYDAAKLEFMSISSASGSAFNFDVQATGGGGAVRIIRGVSSGSVSGKQRVASVTFKALTSSGSADLQLANDSAINWYDDGSNIWNEELSKITLNFTEPPAAPASSSPAAKTTQNSQTPAKEAAKVSSNQNLPDDTPVPVGGSIDGSTSGGYLVAVQAFDRKGLGVSNVDVKLGGKTEKTDSLGIASFIGVKPGEYKLQAKGFKETKVKVVDNGNKTQVQNFKLKAQNNIIYKILGFLAVLIVIGYVIRLILQKRRGSPKGGITIAEQGISKDLNDKAPGNVNVRKLSTSELLNKIPGASTPKPDSVIRPDVKE